jgi:hypothetical protein
VAAAVGLEEHAGPGHPVASAAVAGRSSSPSQGDPGLAQEATDRPGRDVQLGAFVGHQALGEMDRVEPRIGRPGELDELRPARVVETIDRSPAAVAVDQGGGAAGPVPLDEPPDLADRDLQHRGCLLDAQLMGQDMVEHIEALLRPGIQADRLPRFHRFESDKIAVPLTRTESLASNRTSTAG